MRICFKGEKVMPGIREVKIAVTNKIHDISEKNCVPCEHKADYRNNTKNPACEDCPIGKQLKEYGEVLDGKRTITVNGEKFSLKKPPKKKEKVFKKKPGRPVGKKDSKKRKTAVISQVRQDRNRLEDELIQLKDEIAKIKKVVLA
jgi:hypothetical protein